MKLFFLTAVITLFLFSCQDKKIGLLSKKWDCVKIENLDSLDKHFQSAEDSINAVNMQKALSSLTWTFTSNKEYQCHVDGKVTTSGHYTLADKSRTLVCAPSSENNINTYTIVTLTDDDLVLSSTGNRKPIIMHFRPH